MGKPTGFMEEKREKPAERTSHSLKGLERVFGSIFR